MGTSVQEALKIGLVNDQIHTLVISGGTGVGKSFIVRQCLEAWHIPYRVIPVYIDTSELQESIDFEASLAQGKMVMASSLLDDDSTHCWLIDDGHVLAPEVRHALLIEAKRRHILLIMTINHENQTLDDAEWELVDVHVSMEAPSLESRIAVLQQNREEIECRDASKMEKFIVRPIQDVAVPDAMLSLAISYALQAHTVGHDAEYVLLQVMKSLAVLDGSSYCKPVHAERAALYVLPHRMKRDEISESQPSSGNSSGNQEQTQAKDTTDTDDSNSTMDSNTNDSPDEEPNPNGPADSNHIGETEEGASNQEESSESCGSDSTSPVSDDGMDTDGNQTDRNSDLVLPDTVAQIANKMFQWKLESSKTVDRQYRKGSGRRLMTKQRIPEGA